MKVSLIAAGSLLAALCINPAFAGDRATKPEAEAMVKKAIEYIKASGTEKAYTEITDRKGQFVDRDLYIVVYDLQGKCLAHGGNAKLVGKDLSDSTDADGKAFVRERMDLAKTKQSFWQEYKFSNPVDKKIEPKETYCERLNDVAVCGGIYKS